MCVCFCFALRSFLFFRCANVSSVLLLMLSVPDDSINTLRVKMLVLLDQDEPTRAALCAAGASDLFATRTPVCPKKATGFFHGLHEELLPRWVKDEAVTLVDLIEDARMLYLIA